MSKNIKLDDSYQEFLKKNNASVSDNVSLSFDSDDYSHLSIKSNMNDTENMLNLIYYKYQRIARLALVICISIFISLASLYYIYISSSLINAKKYRIQVDMNMYLLSLDCEVSEFEVINGEITYSAKLGQNTNEIIKYLNSEGYYISIKEKNNKVKKLIDFQKDYRTKHRIEGKFKDISENIRNEMNDSGYQWK